MRLFYARHGLTDWNAAGRLQGRLDVPLNQVGRATDGIPIIPIALLQLQRGLEVLWREIAQLGVDRDFADAVARTLIHRKRQEEALPIGGQLRACIRDLDVGVAVFQVEAAQQFPIVRQALRLILVGGGQKAPPAGFAAVDHFRQPVFAERLVAVDDDLADQCGAAVVDLKHDINPVLIQADAAFTLEIE